MRSDGPTLEQWERWAPAEQRAWATGVAGRLAQPATVRLVRRGKRRLAIFDLAGASFVLVPGGPVELGFDVDAFSANAAQQRSYAETAEQFTGVPTLAEHLRRVTTPIRKRHLPALLIETAAREVGLRPVAATDPEVMKAARKLAEGGSTEIFRGGGPPLRVTRQDGEIRAWRTEPCPRADFFRELAAAGMRLLTSDEWEHACGAGARTLFRWGNHCPCDRTPHDNTADEARRRHEWVSKGGAFVRDKPDWSRHLVPNAFGLTIARDPYQNELVEEPGVWRGGDGGSAMCGGMPFFLCWLPLATSYLDPELVGPASGAAPPEDLSGQFVRRAIPLG